MKLSYKLIIEDPQTHIVKVLIKGEKKESANRIDFFLPSWSPGSYLMREYARHIRNFKATLSNGEYLYFEKQDKGLFCIDWTKSDLNDKGLNTFEISYEVYCHELTVRTSHVDISHAFIHGPSVFMGIRGESLYSPTLEVEFPGLWSKISTGLKDISPKREIFLYEAKDYDELIDTPLEIGCHETDGFRVDGIDHELAFFGKTYPHKWNLKADIKLIVEHISKTMRDIPYEKYTFITHFAPGLFGGLEHLNSTALQFCSQSLTKKEDYIDWLELVAHEYFHTWNVKRIRPLELGPFDYLTEAKTRMHWLTEGLTSFMDQLFIYRTGLMDQKEYLKRITKNMNALYKTPGRHYDSLEDSSYDAWIKLYRPDENSKNSSVSYYLKGGLVFFVLNILLFEKGKSITDLLDLLWESYKAKPEKGLEREEVLSMIETLGGTDLRDQFEEMISTTKEIDFEAHLKTIGIKVEWETPKGVDFGINAKFDGDRVLCQSVVLDSSAHKSGLNAGDEILAINDMRVLKGSWSKLSDFIELEKEYKFTVSRLGYIQEVYLLAHEKQKVIKELVVDDEILSRKALMARMPKDGP